MLTLVQLRAMDVLVGLECLTIADYNLLNMQRFHRKGRYLIMTKKIVINKTELTVEQLYPYRYDYGKGKEVLQIEVLETNHSFDEIKLLTNEDNQTIKYYEENEKKNEYVGYCKDFSCNYADGKYSIEVTRISESDLKINELEQKITENTEVLNTLLLSDLGGAN